MFCQSDFQRSVRRGLDCGRYRYDCIVEEIRNERITRHNNKYMFRPAQAPPARPVVGFRISTAPLLASALLSQYFRRQGNNHYYHLASLAVPQARRARRQQTFLIVGGLWQITTLILLPLLLHRVLHFELISLTARPFFQYQVTDSVFSISASPHDQIYCG